MVFYFIKKGDTMKKYIGALGAIFLSVIIVLSGCTAKKSNINEEGPFVYYISKDSKDLVAIKADVPDTTKKAQAEFLINQLISPHGDSVSPLGKGTKLNSILIKDEIAEVNFSQEFSKVSELKAILAPTAVAKTLCSLDFISGVHIFIEGEEALGADGKPLGVILESELVINKSEPTQSPKTTVTLYFGDENAEFLVAERREVEVSNSSTLEKIIMDELLSGPKKSGNIRTIPQETKVLSIETKNKVCFVNLSSEFVNKHSGGTAAEKLTVYSVVNSLCELSTIDKIQFLIEGEKCEEYVHMVFNEPIFPDRTIIKK